MEKKEKTTGQRIDEMTDKISDVASELGEKLETGAEETKKVASGVKKWRDTSSIEEIITTILGILLLACALWKLRAFIWGVLLLLAGILCVAGFFNPFLKGVIEKLNLQCKSKKHTKKDGKKDSEKKSNK